MTVLEAKGVEVSYGPVEVLRGASLAVGKGDFALLIGVNGAGKSTFLKAAFGMLPLKAGSICFGGADLAGHSTMQRINHGMALVPQGRRVFPTLTVKENLELVSVDCEPALEFFPRLRTKLGEKAGFLSGGEQQMVSLARALLLRPKLLMLDEPSLGLAPKIVEQVFDKVKEINQAGTSVLMVEQNVKAALEHADYAFVLDGGKVRQKTDARHALKSESFKKAYLGI